MKFDFSKIATRAIQIAGPILLAALTHKLVTGKLDVKGAALDAAGQVLGQVRG